MFRTEKGRVRKLIDELLVELLRSAISAWSLSLLLRLFSLQEVVLPTLGALVLTSGIVYAVGLWLYRPRANRSAYRPLREAQAALARVWIGVGAILVALGTLSKPPVVLPIVGAVVCWVLYRRAGVLATKQGRCLRAANRPVRVGALATAALTIPLLLISYTGFAYAGMEAVELYKHSTPPSGEEEGEAGRSEADSPSELDEEGGEEPPPPSYADLCSALPDPRQIGYGLGVLFEHDGAVAAGCGGPAERVGGSTWVSAGFCGSELRSLAVVGERREPVLIYGAPADFARTEAERGELRFAEAARLGGGEVVLIGTARGTIAFARPTPALDPGEGDAVRCGEIDEVARPFAQLDPPLAKLWLDHMASEQEWFWPQPGEGTADVVLKISDRLPVYGSCESPLLCRLDGPGVHEVEEGSAEITLDELKTYAPPHPETDQPSSNS